MYFNCSDASTKVSADHSPSSTPERLVGFRVKGLGLKGFGLCVDLAYLGRSVKPGFRALEGTSVLRASAQRSLQVNGGMLGPVLEESQDP